MYLHPRLSRPSLLIFTLLLSACEATSPDGKQENLLPRPPEAGELLIAQLYTSGAAEAGGTDHYFADQFIELVNASNTPLDLSGVGVANVYGSAGEINPGMAPDSFRESRPDEVVMSSLWRIPEAVLLQPGDALVIAHDGTNHRPFSDLDLSSANFETFVDDYEGTDMDYPTVANLESEVYNGGYDWLMTVFGPSVVIIDADSTVDEVPGPYSVLPTVSIDAVIDGVDTVMDENAGAFKRLPDAVDQGFAWHDGPYTGTAIHRLKSNGTWQDTNDSSQDFEVGPPNPTLPTGSDGVFGDPWIELGTGIASYTELADDDTIEIVAGPQGGWHLDVALWFGGFGPNGVTLGYEAVTTDAESISFLTQAKLQEANVLEANEGWHRVGDRIVLDISAAEEVNGDTLILRVTAVLGAQTWSDERSVRVVDEE